MDRSGKMKRQIKETWDNLRNPIIEIKDCSTCANSKDGIFDCSLLYNHVVDCELGGYIYWEKK